MPANTQPLVSIITPAYNFAEFLPETIESVLAQDYDNIEYIVLDDGSTDNTMEILQRYTGRITWESHANMGEADTVNKGLQMAAGDYFIIVNADDPVLPGLVSIAVTFMEANPDVLVGYPRWLEIDAEGHTIGEFETYDYHYVDMIKGFYCMPGVGSIIRRRAIELAGGRDKSLRWASDMEHWFRIGLYGPFARIPHVLATHRTHPRAKTQADKGIAMMQEYIRVVDKIYERDDLPPEVLAARSEAFSNVYYIAGAYSMSHSWSMARQFFIQSIRHCPLCYRKYPWGFRRSWLLMLRVILFPRFFNKFLKRLWVPVKPLFSPGK